MPALRRMGIPVLRRISGGGAVYHDLGNLNYALITRQEGAADYERSLAPILEALRAAARFNVGVGHLCGALAAGLSSVGS